MTTILAWHFLTEDRMTAHEPRVLVTAGLELTVEPPLVICHRGLHASRRALDALRYAPGSIVCRVEVSGDVIEQSDRLCGSHRKVLWIADATNALHCFAVDVAEQALVRERGHGREPDERSWDAIRVKRLWISGEASDSELAAAWTAARAAWNASDPRNTAWTSARAAWYASEVAGDVAKTATLAARIAVWDTSDAARAAQNAMLEKRLEALDQEEPRNG